MILFLKTQMKLSSLVEDTYDEREHSIEELRRAVDEISQVNTQISQQQVSNVLRPSKFLAGRISTHSTFVKNDSSRNQIRPKVDQAISREKVDLDSKIRVVKKESKKKVTIARPTVGFAHLLETDRKRQMVMAGLKNLRSINSKLESY